MAGRSTLRLNQPPGVDRGCGRRQLVPESDSRHATCNRRNLGTATARQPLNGCSDDEQTRGPGNTGCSAWFRVRNDAHRGSVTQGSTVLIPVLRNSPVFRVTMTSPRVDAVAARKAPGTWSSSGSPSRRLSSMIRAQACASANDQSKIRSSNSSSTRSWNRMARSRRRRPGSIRPIPSSTSQTEATPSPRQRWNPEGRRPGARAVVASCRK